MKAYIWVDYSSHPFRLLEEANQYHKSADIAVNPLSANPTQWSNTLKQFVGFRQRIL